MKKLLLFMLVLISFNAKSQDLKTKINEAQTLYKAIIVDIDKADQSKPVTKSIIDRVSLFHQKVEDIQAASTSLGACATLCGVFYVACVQSCGGYMYCTIACQMNRDLCVLECNSQSLVKR